MVEKYNKIYLLVHPLYDLFLMQGFYKQVTDNLIDNPIIEKLNSKHKPTTNEFKKIIGIYGDQINKISKEEASLLIIFTPQIGVYDRYEHKMSFEKYSELKKEFYKTLKLQKQILSKFTEFTNRNLKNRVVYSNYNPHANGNPDVIGTPKFMTKTFINKLSKDVRILAFGEYRKLCVSTWATAIQNRLASFGIHSKIHTIKRRTIDYKSKLNIQNAVGFEKAILPKTEKRKVQQKLKKQKLRFNQMVKKQLAHI